MHTARHRTHSCRFYFDSTPTFLTPSGQVHRFFGFWTQQTYHDTFNVLDRQWRTRPYTSTQPLKAGEVPLLSRSMVPPINYASPSVMVLEPAQFQPEPATNLYASRSLSSSVLRTAPPYAAAAMPTSMRQSFSGRPAMETAEFRPDAASSSWMPSETSYMPSERFSGKQAQRFQSRSAAFSRTLPPALLNDIRRANIASLRRVGAPSPRYGHVIADFDNRIQLVPLESYGTAPRAFGVASQGRQFRTPHYLPKQTARSAYQQPPRRFEAQEEEAHIPVQLANDIKHYPHQRLHHVNPAYHTAVPLGHVVDQRASWQPRQSQQQQRTGFVPRERLGFQTVQQRLHTSQRGRSLNPQLQDEIRFFNLRSLHHVTPVVRQWWPQAVDIKMRPAGGQERAAEGHEARRHRHHHHKHQRSERGAEAAAPVQVFQYEEYDLASPNKYERVQVTKFQEQLSRKEADLQQQQSGAFIPTAGGRTFEAGTA